MNKKALITGVSGQDGYFLSRLLLEKGYEVHGLARRNSQKSLGSLELLPKEERMKIKIHWGDIIDTGFINSFIAKEQYDEIYHLAAQSFVSLSFTNPKATYDINISGTLNMVNAVKEHSPHSKFYFAATSELYGKAKEFPQTEETPFYPRSPYGVSKLAGFWTVKNYREAYGLFMSNGILFNHESEMRGEEFVTRKVSLAVANIALGRQEHFEIGNLDSKRDWGYAVDYVEGMWKMLQQEEPDDFVLATGENHTIREFIEQAFAVIDKAIVWESSGVDEVGKDKKTGEILVKVNPQYFRPAEVEELVGDYSKAKAKLSWQPRVTFDGLVKIMVESDINILKARQ
ncbi:MAG: GDP-mannose 4,6-dehydratase [Minisyncoccota bacterium]